MGKRGKPPEMSETDVAYAMQAYVKFEELKAKIGTIERDHSAMIRLLPELQRAGGEPLKTTIGKLWGDRQCPVWLPQDPNIPHAQRTRCVVVGPHDRHTDTYLIEEQTLD